MLQSPAEVSCREHDHISQVRVSAVTYIDEVHVVNRTFRIDWTHHGKESRHCSQAPGESAHSTEPASSSEPGEPSEGNINSPQGTDPLCFLNAK